MRYKKRGDEALIEYTKKFDCELINLKNIKVTKQEILDGYNNLSDELKKTYELAKNRIWDFHEHQKENTWMYENNGEILGQKITPIENVGLYIPGGKAAYPSTVFMDAIPAIIAGVKKLLLQHRAIKKAKFRMKC